MPTAKEHEIADLRSTQQRLQNARGESIRGHRFRGMDGPARNTRGRVGQLEERVSDLEGELRAVGQVVTLLLAREIKRLERGRG